MDIRQIKEIYDPVDRAIIFATFAHKNSVRKGSKIPYILHPIEAGNIAATITSDREIIAAVVLHDIAEDTEYTLEDIEHFFGKRVCKLVAADTENKRKSLPSEQTWKIRKQETIDYLDNFATYEEKIVVFSDKLANLRSTYNNYVAEGDDVWKRFNEKRKECHLWYLENILKAVPEFKGMVAYEEYELLLHRIFDE